MTTRDDPTTAARALAADRATLGAVDAPLAGPSPLIDVHAHFYHQRSPRGDWPAVNLARIRAGERIGISWHVASVLGTWGHTSPTYFPSPDDVTFGNDVMLGVARALPDRVRAYATVNPNFPSHAIAEIARCVDAGAIGEAAAGERRVLGRERGAVGGERAPGQRRVVGVGHPCPSSRRLTASKPAAAASPIARSASSSSWASDA